MKGKDFFSNLRDTEDAEYDFTLPTKGKVPPNTNDVVQSLSQEKGANNINITITVNKELFAKIDSLQKAIQAKSNARISKSKVIAKICEQFLENYDIS
ncbi:MAG: hypothetical protein SNG27_05450 [Rikenellaceae bacterium]